MKDMKIKAAVRQEVYIDPADAFKRIKEALGFYEDNNSFVCVKDGELVRGEDVSHHGSPIYQYKSISNNPRWIELYNSVECLNDYFKHSEEQQWDRVVDHDEAENTVADNAPERHPLRSKILNHYKSIEQNVQKHSKLPSFMSMTAGKAQNVELEWNGKEYTASLTNNNGVLDDYSFSGSGLSFSVSGNTLTITAKNAPDSVAVITAEKKNSKRRGIIYQIEYGAIAACADMVKIRISFAYDCFSNKKLSCDYMGDFITALVLAFPFGGNTAGIAVLHNSAYILLDLIRLYGAVILRRIVFPKILAPFRKPVAVVQRNAGFYTVTNPALI